MGARRYGLLSGALVSALAGCSDQPTCRTHAAAHVVTMCWGEATYVAYRDGDSDWLVPEHEPGRREWNFCVNDDFVVIAVYDPKTIGGYRAYQVASTATEPDPLDWCGAPENDWDRRDVRVSGQMQQPGGVQIDGMEEGSESSPWSYALTVASGVHDVVAVTPDDRIAVRRDVDIRSATTLPVIDMDAEGVTMMAVPLSLDSLLADESVGTSTTVLTNPNDYGFLPTTDTATAVFLPSQLRRANDRQWLDVYADSGSFGRGASVEFTGSETSFQLLPRISADALTFDFSTVPMISWTSLPVDDYSYVSLSFGSGRSYFASASRRWLEMHGSSSIALDYSAPGYSSDWHFDASRPYLRSFYVSDVRGPICYSTGYSETLNQPSPLQLSAPALVSARPARAPRTDR